jgi:hypothetical protein
MEMNRLNYSVCGVINQEVRKNFKKKKGKGNKVKKVSAGVKIIILI